MYTKTNQGFSLIELLMVIAIIGVIVSIAMVSLATANEKGRDASRLQQAREIQKALDLYFSENGNYPISSWTCSYQTGWETGALGNGLEPWLETMPVDPVNESVAGHSGGLSYCYYSNGYGGAGEWYMLIVPQENPNTDLDSRDGVQTCASNFFNYDGDNGYILTFGGHCTI